MRPLFPRWPAACPPLAVWLELELELEPPLRSAPCRARFPTSRRAAPETRAAPRCAPTAPTAGKNPAPSAPTRNANHAAAARAAGKPRQGRGRQRGTSRIGVSACFLQREIWSTALSYLHWWVELTYFSAVIYIVSPTVMTGHLPLMVGQFNEQHFIYYWWTGYFYLLCSFAAHLSVSCLSHLLRKSRKKERKESSSSSSSFLAPGGFTSWDVCDSF